MAHQLGTFSLPLDSMFHYVATHVMPKTRLWQIQKKVGHLPVSFIPTLRQNQLKVAQQLNQLEPLFSGAKGSKTQWDPFMSKDDAEDQFLYWLLGEDYEYFDWMV